MTQAWTHTPKPASGKIVNRRPLKMKFSYEGECGIDHIVLIHGRHWSITANLGNDELITVNNGFNILTVVQGNQVHDLLKSDLSHVYGGESGFNPHTRPDELQDQANDLFFAHRLVDAVLAHLA